MHFEMQQAEVGDSGGALAATELLRGKYSYDETQVTTAIGRVLSHLSKLNQELPYQLTPFQSAEPPSVPIEKYMDRMRRYMQIHPFSYVIALYYMDTIITSATAGVVVNAHSIHRLYLACLRLATKFYDDAFYGNEHFANIGGVPLTEMNLLEVEALFAIEFSLYMPPEAFDEYMSALHLSNVRASDALSPSPSSSAAAPVPADRSVAELKSLVPTGWNQ